MSSPHRPSNIPEEKINDKVISNAYKIEAAAKAIYIAAQAEVDAAKLDLSVGDAISMVEIIVDLAQEQVRLLNDFHEKDSFADDVREDGGTLALEKPPTSSVKNAPTLSASDLEAAVRRLSEIANITNSLKTNISDSFQMDFEETHQNMVLVEALVGQIGWLAESCSEVMVGSKHSPVRGTDASDWMIA